MADRTVPSLEGSEILHIKMFTFFVCCFVAKKGNFLAGKGLCYVVNFVALTCFLGLGLMQTFSQTFVPILSRFLHKKLVINSSDFFCVPYPI